MKLKRRINAIQRGAVSHDNLIGSATIGPEGGTVRVPGAGLSISILAGALAATSSISVTAHRALHGFNVQMTPKQDLAKPAVVEQRLEADHLKLPRLALAFVPSGVDIHAEAEEFYATELVGDIAVAQVPHFSGYMWSSGAECEPGPDNPDCIEVI